METNRKWLWLEDSISTVSDISQELTDSKIVFEKYNNPNKLIEFLTQKKIVGASLNCYGLIIDVMLKGNQFIQAPQEWTKLNKQSLYSTVDGYDAGLVFCEQFIFNKDGNWIPFWQKPLPPIIFLSTLIYDEKTSTRVNELKDAWAKNMGKDISDAKISWFRKWDMDFNEFVNQLKTW